MGVGDTSVAEWRFGTAGNRLGEMMPPAGVGLLAGIVGTPIVFVAAAFTLIGSAWWMKGAPVEPAQSD